MLSNKFADKHIEYVVRMTLLDPNNFEKYDLYYKLFNIPLAKKWVKQFEQLKKGPQWFRERKKHSEYGKIDQSLVQKFNSLISIINSFYDQKLSFITKVSEDELNILHEAYALYGQRNQEKLDKKYWDHAYKLIPAGDPKTLIWPGITFNEDMHDAFIKLNDLIHQTELFMNNEEQTDNGFILVASFNPRIDIPLEEEDLPALKINLDFGDLCLGYNTLGKSLKHIVLDEDRESLEKGLVMPQETWSNEIFINMKGSNNHSWSQQNYYRKWKKVRPEDFGFQYGDTFKNREGYYCIGELVPEQTVQLWDPVTRTLTFDFERFTDIHSVEIIHYKQAKKEFLTPSKRLPQWKEPRPLLGKKVFQIENEKYSVVTWVLNDICNYSCRYCPDDLHNGKNYKQDNWENISAFIDHILEYLSADDKKVLFSLSGGEPTLSPFFPILIKHVYDLGHCVTVTTNLSRTERFIKENFKYLLGASCSFHPAFEFKNNTHNEFLKKLEIANSVTYVAVRVMMDPLYWDKTVEFIERIKKETSVDIEIVMIDDQYSSSSKKLLDISYTPEQLDYFKNFKGPGNTYEEKGYNKRKTYAERGIIKPLVYFDDGSRQPLYAQELINKGQTNFYGYKCDIGKSSIFIRQDGQIKKGNCMVGGKKWGTLSEWQSIDWYNFKQPIICTDLGCYCGGDVLIKKQKITKYF